ncbi:L,D-transpeptidase family protein [Methylomonas sp. MO1]|uniref:L,D-transpeptidase family protein n=1 Tax=Methylomonas sp. MO1 TaxID=3073619 RepID=UPI0028A45400|nr:L,D-transpeptidase family protein [Methylomonas sp. MO1]MDT4291058.1 L,D-transpeptidase family protein [Methylomonas sp. MO1]
MSEFELAKIMTQQAVSSSNQTTWRNSPPYLLTVLMLLYFFSQSASSQSPELAVGQAIQSLLASKQQPLLSQADFSQYSDALKQLYQMNANQLIWLGEGRTAKNREDALSLLSNAKADGLNPDTYEVERLRGYLQQAVTLPKNATTELVSYDMALSIALVHFARDLHVGRVDPRDFDYPAQFAAKSASDVAVLLNQHIQQQTLAELPAALAPKFKQYQQLKTLLAAYRQQNTAAQKPKLLLAKSLRPGEQDAQLPELRRRLLDLGELKAEDVVGAGNTETLYDAVATEAVKRLQQQQGLKADGVIGKQTLALLNQTPADKIAMLELAMERWRWMPELPEGPRIFVNIPAFQLWAFNSRDDQQPLTMKVIVGKAEKNQTPVLWEDMKYLEFMPYWNIPKSIMDKEMLPKLLSDEEFLTSQDIELVGRYADDEDDDENQDSIVDEIKSGRVRARQRPGSNNPLGRVKFIFPNKADVYLHDTPGKAAFNRDRRDLSHGCVRVAEAGKLAEFVLGDQSEWDQQTIQQAMAGPKTQRVTLKKSIPVLFFYTTVFVGLDDKPRFYPDIYGQDELLQTALSKAADPGAKQQLVSKTVNSAGGG